MRIATLELSPYGHLAHARLELPAPPGGPGLYVLSGRNGAGKSTSLRALDGALFGISRRTRDTHTHPGPALKIGISLERTDGELVSFERRKRDKQSLSTSDGTVVDEALLREFLGGLPPEEFRAMFLLDCNKLEEGSEDLLEGRGQLGEALFGAALGLGRVHKVLAELDAEADALWVKGGARTLNHNLKMLAEARKEKRKSRLDPETWMGMRRELDEAEQELLTVQKALGDLAQAIGQSARHERCLAPLTKRRLALEGLNELPATPELPASFPAEVRAARASLEDAEQKTAGYRDELERVEDELDAHPDPGPIADREDAVNSLYQRSGESDKASKDLPRREAELAAHRDDLQRLLARARPGHDANCIDALTVTNADRARLEELASERSALGQAHKDAKQTVDRLTRSAALHEATAPAAPTMSQVSQDALAKAVEAASDAGDLDTAARDDREHARLLREAADRACASLPGWNLDINELERLEAPSIATVQRFTKERAALDRGWERLTDRDIDLNQRTGVLEHDEDRLARGPAAPTLAEVTNARRIRDDALDALIERPAQDDDRALLVREGVRAADHLADTRADYAEAAAARDRLERDRSLLDSARDKLRIDLDAHEALVADFDERWRRAWPKLPSGPDTPEEMHASLSTRAEILGTLNEAREDEASAERAGRAIEDHLSALAQAGEQPARTAGQDASLASALGSARATLAAVVAARSNYDEHQREQHRISDELTDASGRVLNAEKTLADWRAAWEPVTTALGLAASTTPAQARAQLAAVDEVVSAYDSIVSLEHRIAAMQKDQDNFAIDARDLAAELAPDLSQTEPLAIADALHARAAKARSARATREQLEPRRRDLTLQAQSATRASANATKTLESLAERAGVTPQALDELCNNIDARASLCDELDRAVAELEAAGAQPAAELAAALVNATPEGLTASRAADESQVETLETHRGDLERTAGRLRAQLEEAGGDEAALAGEREANERAAVLDGLERYTELRLAAAALRAAMERHRKEHQGPLLKRAGELFARLSGHEMIGLTVVTDERQPYIMGVLPDNREVPVQDMSSGQRHQLFLALRLASLERHFAHSEPMPLVLDDLLVQLDDTSAHAALEILAELARTTQVLLFTHHDHLVTMARNAVPADLLVEHEVGTESRSTLRAA